jgi:glycosyltransferase involved in cell wall biosynthesis
MRILFCCEFYAPSIGGVQMVVRQIAERLVQRGHQVTVATSKLSNRDFESLNGVHIKEFSVSGNFLSGVVGDEDGYRNYVIDGDFDVIMIKAAQQWTFDALWPVLDHIRAPKVFIPCGFSGLFDPSYAEYYLAMPDILNKFKHLIFYASHYRDIDFAREHGLNHFSVIPNGASEIEFSVDEDATFRIKHDIKQNSFVFMTVGSFTGSKGHLELIKAFSLMDLPEQAHATLILNGNECLNADGSGHRQMMGCELYRLAKTQGWKFALKHTLKRELWKIGITVGNADNVPGLTIQELAVKINKNYNNRQVIISDLARAELVQAYMMADLFVFASNIEYSPLVLFEAAAAGTPFLTVSVGNSEEIATWTGAGIMCPSYKDVKGYTRVDEAVLAHAMGDAMLDKSKLNKLGTTGKSNWQEKFTWEKISYLYEDILRDALVKK